MKTLLICHEGAQLDQNGLARWLGSFSELVGVVVIRETGDRWRGRIRREIRRSGLFRFADIVGFRLFYRLMHARADRRWEKTKLRELCETYPPIPEHVPVLLTSTPNSAEVEEFIRQRAPDLTIARCKTLLKQKIFTIPERGTFVMHPGICPEYRNAHGCFWALARNDRNRVGMTLLQIDTGVDTGPIYGYYPYTGSAHDEVRESHTVIQHRIVVDHLDEVRQQLLEIGAGRATPLDVGGRASATWGQPWLTSYLKWKKEARHRAE